MSTHRHPTHRDPHVANGVQRLRIPFNSHEDDAFRACSFMEPRQILGRASEFLHVKQITQRNPHRHFKEPGAFVNWLTGHGAVQQQASLCLCCEDGKVSLFVGDDSEGGGAAHNILCGLRAASPMLDGTTVETREVIGKLTQFACSARLFGHPTPPDAAAPRKPSALTELLRSYHGERWALAIRLLPRPDREDLKKLLMDEYDSSFSGLTEVAKERRDVDDYRLLLEVWIERLGTSEVLWLPEIVFFAPDDAKAQQLAAAYAGSLGVSELFPLRPHSADRSVQEALRFESDFPWSLRRGITTAEAACLFEWPEEEWAGLKVRSDARFGITTPSETAGSQIKLGEIQDRDRGTGRGLYLPVEYLTRHVLVSGMTGYGKTNTCKHLLESIWESNPIERIPFLIVEPAKSEYSSWLEKLCPTGNIFEIGGNRERALRLNPFIPSAGFPIQPHIDFVCQLFQSSFAMFGAQPYMLSQAIHAAYRAAGWDLEKGINSKHGTLPEGYPTISSVKNCVLEVVKATGYEKELRGNLRAALEGRLQELIEGGTKPIAYNASVTTADRELFEKPCLICMTDIVRDDEKAFLMGLIFIRLYEYHQVRNQHRAGKICHVTLCEEAHRLFRRVQGAAGGETANPRALSVETFTSMMGEVRSFGECLIIAEQIPTLLVPSAIKNTSTKITHKTEHAEDRHAIGEAINLSDEQRDRLGQLLPGHAVVQFPGLHQPFHLHMTESPGHSASRPGTLNATVRSTSYLQEVFSVTRKVEARLEPKRWHDFKAAWRLFLAVRHADQVSAGSWLEQPVADWDEQVNLAVEFWQLARNFYRGGDGPTGGGESKGRLLADRLVSRVFRWSDDNLASLDVRGRKELGLLVDAHQALECRCVYCQVSDRSCTVGRMLQLRPAATEMDLQSVLRSARAAARKYLPQHVKVTATLGDRVAECLLSNYLTASGVKDAVEVKERIESLKKLS